MYMYLFEKHYCYLSSFYLFLSSRKYLVQALSEEDRKSWLEIMEGKEPVYSSLKVIECTYVIITSSNSG